MIYTPKLLEVVASWRSESPESPLPDINLSLMFLFSLYYRAWNYNENALLFHA